MKKLLLVLLVLAIASFLFVGCLPVTPSEGEGEGEGEGEVEVAITFDKEYTNAGGVTFVPCGDTVTVTFPSPVDIDYVAYIAIKYWNDSTGEYEYYRMESGEPDASRTVWTFAEYIDTFCEWKSEPDFCADECEPICLVALVKHPCCPGEEVALRIVSIDCTAPTLDLFVKFTDCDDPCDDPDPCLPEFEGVSMEWTSRTSDICDTEDCCDDTCSGVNGWSLVIDPDPCEGPCDTVTGTGCPVEGVIGCECLAYADTGEVCYSIEFSFEDNVGNAVESNWEICLDTDEVTAVRIDYDPSEPFNPIAILSPDSDGWYRIHSDCYNQAQK